jgi:hypothetical protein
MTDKKRLGELILDTGLITEADLDKALRLQVGGTHRLGYILIKMGFISENVLQTVLSRQLGLPIINIDQEFDPEVRKILPKYLCQRYSVIPLRNGENNTLTVAMVDPSDSEAVSDIEQYTGKIIQPLLASKSDISANIRSRIPWTLRDIFNSRTSTRWTAAALGLAILLIIVFAAQFYQDRQSSRYGKVSHSAQSTTYENLELILGFDSPGTRCLFSGAAPIPPVITPSPSTTRNPSGISWTQKRTTFPPAARMAHLGHGQPEGKK